MVTDVQFMEIDTNRAKFPLAVPPYPPEFFAPVGIIGLAWGSYESTFDQHLGAVLGANGSNPKHWQHISYKRRRDLYKAESRKCFDGRPKLGRYIAAILTDSGSLHLKRNLILHGKQSVSITARHPLPPHIWLIAEGKSTTMRFTLDELVQLGYDIMHLTGRFGVFDDPEHSEAPGLSSEDKYFVQEILSRHTPPPPASTPAKSPDRR